MVNSKLETREYQSTECNDQSAEELLDKSYIFSSSLESPLPSREERLIHSALRRFKTVMKSTWCNLYKLKTQPKIYVICFLKFEKSYCLCTLSRNDVKYIFDRIIDHMFVQDWPTDIFEGKNCINGTNFRNDSYIQRFCSISGMKELYEMHHKLASYSDFYFRNRLYARRQLSKHEKDLIVNFCALQPLMHNSI